MLGVDTHMRERNKDNVHTITATKNVAATIPAGVAAIAAREATAVTVATVTADITQGPTVVTVLTAMVGISEATMSLPVITVTQNKEMQANGIAAAATLMSGGAKQDVTLSVSSADGTIINTTTVCFTSTVIQASTTNRNGLDRKYMRIAWQQE
jgi:hypothetical protein